MNVVRPISIAVIDASVIVKVIVATKIGSPAGISYAGPKYVPFDGPVIKTIIMGCLEGRLMTERKIWGLVLAVNWVSSHFWCI